MSHPLILSMEHELVVDCFAGAGGASIGIEAAIGRPVDVAINHDPKALHVHQLNHPGTRHYCENIRQVDPVQACQGRPVGLAWFSPDCTHFSKAKGATPRKKSIRGLAWVVLRWASKVKPRVICLENVEEFQDWGPLTRKGQPCKRRKGQTFSMWVGHLEALGYAVEWRCLKACDYGAPTTRKRLFLVARRDGMPIRWPEHTHGEGLQPYRTAAECIDWSLPCPSIFERKRPLAQNTMRRIARGIQRFVIENPAPYIVAIDNGNGQGGAWRSDEPLKTIVTENRFAVVAPFIAPLTHHGADRVNDIQKPMPTVTTAHRGEYALMAASLIKHYGGVTGHKMERPIGTVTAKDHHALCAAHLVKMRGTSTAAPMNAPMPTITAGGNHLAEVRAFLVKYYGTGDAQQLNEPMHTVTSKDRLGLVMVHGQEYQIVDIGMRMLQPHELAKAQGFPDGYILEGTKSTQVRLIGNSVCNAVAEALVRANYGAMAQEGAA